MIMVARRWSLWAKAGAVGNAPALSTASWLLRAAHRPQIHCLAPGRFGKGRAACLILGCLCRFKIEPLCRPNFEPGVNADRVMVSCG